jgi:hypothetical protein
MRQAGIGEEIPEVRRKEIFGVLVLGQDLEMTVAESRRMACERFGLAEGQVREIEREGIRRKWPPL